ncbi:MAG: hypothetical protein KDK33_00660 [Leptospiraceae bacterium]|nr:hypothetical protein [Leptospiraceae bacterium]
MELSVLMEPVTNQNPLERLSAPPMIYKPSSPVEVEVIENTLLTPEDYSEEIRHIVLDLKGTDYRYLEGQSMGVIAPGEDEKGKPNRVRLYSIASPAMGEPGAPSHVALCVKRVAYEESGTSYYGLCSNYLCDVKPGDKVKISGPNGKRFVMPRDPEVDLLLFATGTGIAPFRGFFMRLAGLPAEERSHIVLYYGSRTMKDHVYYNAINNDLGNLADSKNIIHSALSREDPNQKLHVQDRFRLEPGPVEEALKRGNFLIYICGIKGMEKGIEDVFRQIVGEDSWDATKQEWKEKTIWNQEVY